MLRFLSAEWVAALDAAAAGLGVVSEAPFVVEQVVRTGDTTEVRWQMRFAPDGVRFAAHAAAPADVTLTTDLATAAAVSRGETSAQAAFMAGRLRLGGDTAALIRNAGSFAKATDAFAAVRARTEYAPA